MLTVFAHNWSQLYTPAVFFIISEHNEAFMINLFVSLQHIHKLRAKVDL